MIDKLQSVKLPAVLPFDGVELEPRTDTKFYGAGVEPMSLMRAAVNELTGDRIEELKAFLLGLTLGLRRREIDLLEWHSFDFVAGISSLLCADRFATATTNKTTFNQALIAGQVYHASSRLSL